jgi:hypothetical protein
MRSMRLWRASERALLLFAVLLEGAAAACGARSSLDIGALPARPEAGEGGAGGRGAGGSGAGELDAGQAGAPPDVVEPPLALRGCADGTREAFVDEARYPDIAGCSGAFDVPGLRPGASPSCGRRAGNDGEDPSGAGCGANDLCADGYRVCASAADVARRSPDGCAGGADGPPGSFFATAQSGPGCALCATGDDPGCGNNTCNPGCAQTDRTTNDLFGCGDVGERPNVASCAPLDRFSNNLCAALPGSWVCPNAPGGDVRESVLVTKRDASGGGVLCCRD